MCLTPPALARRTLSPCAAHPRLFLFLLRRGSCKVQVHEHCYACKEPDVVIPEEIAAKESKDANMNDGKVTPWDFWKCDVCNYGEVGDEKDKRKGQKARESAAYVVDHLASLSTKKRKQSSSLPKAKHASTLPFYLCTTGSTAS